MKQFVYPATATGEAFRELTRENNLQINRRMPSSPVIGLHYEIKRIPDRILHTLFEPDYDLPRATDEEKLEFFHFNGGTNLCLWNQRHGLRLAQLFACKSIVGL